MSLDDDDSSLQREKLLSSSCSHDEPSDGIRVGCELWVGGTHAAHKSPSAPSTLDELSATSDTIHLRDIESPVDPAVDPDRCYSWLRPTGEDVSVGKRARHGSETSDTTTSSSSLPMPTPPDGGWGWFVVLGAFMISLICDGLSYCFGVLYSELLVQFEESRSKTSMVGSIFFGVAMILGPLASALTTRFGCRTMTIFGGLLAAFGLLLSSFANSIEMLCFTFSVVVGTGFSFCYITGVVIVAFYFDKRRALATGLAVCGTGVGTFTFAPLMDFLIVEYGWRGLFLIMSAICLNLIVCGLLFRPLQFTESERWEMLLNEFNKIPYSRENIEMPRSRYPSGSRYPSDSSDSDEENDDFDDDYRALSVLSLPTFVPPSIVHTPSAVLMEALKNSNNPHHTLQRYMRNAMFHFTHGGLHDPLSSETEVGSPVDPGTYTITLNSSAQQTSKTDNTVDSMPSSFIDDNIQKQPKSLTDKSHNNHNPLNKDVSANHSRKPSKKNHAHSSKVAEKDECNSKLVANTSSSLIHCAEVHKDGNRPHKRQEFSGMSNILTDKGCEMEGKSVGKKLTGMYLGRHNALGIHLPLYRTDIFYRRQLKLSSLHKPCTLGTSCPELSESTTPETKRSLVAQALINFVDEASEIMRSMVDFRLFCNPFFVVFIVSNFIFYFWSDIPYMYATDHAMHVGVNPRKASFLLSIVGIFNTIGQVVFGCLGDLNINLLNIYALVSVLAGVFVAFVPFMTTYTMMCVMYALFGFCISVSYPLTTVLLVNYLGVAKLTNAYGLLMLMQGIANLFGPPFAGWISDETGTYNSTFYMSGFFYAVSGVVLFLLYLPRCRAGRTRSLMEITVDAGSPA